MIPIGPRRRFRRVGRTHGAIEFVVWSIPTLVVRCSAYANRRFHDRAPGVEECDPVANYLWYTLALGFAIVLTMTSFVMSPICYRVRRTGRPDCPCFAQIRVHLCSFCKWAGNPVTQTIIRRSISEC